MRWREYVVATSVTAGATLACLAVDGYLPVGSLALIFLCAVLLVAVRSRISVALYTAVLSSLSYVLFFTEPRLTLRISSPSDVVAVAAFLVTALIAGHLASRLHAQLIALRLANDHTRALQALGERLAAAVDEEAVYTAGCEILASSFGCDCIVLQRQRAQPSALSRAAARPSSVELTANDLVAADWVATHLLAAGRFTGTLAETPWWFSPLIVEGGCLGTVGLRFPTTQPGLATERRQLAEAIVHQLAQAADRTRLVASLEAARVEGETGRLRAALLSSVSHDLRSPLASVIGAASSLSAYGETMPESDRRQLLDSIRSESERLDRYIQNLLDMTRLGSAGLTLHRDWASIDEILGTALSRARKAFPDVRMVADLAPELPLLWVHPALVEQALFNILENAAKFSPVGGTVMARARAAGGELFVEISDSGPGIPEAERTRIFDMFYSVARGDRDARGSGLGLTIVRGMIGAHGGRVTALAGPGGLGTTIRVTLPVTEAPPPPMAEDE
jgi:two-component system sensor histidine kinase KdpD